MDQTPSRTRSAAPDQDPSRPDQAGFLAEASRLLADSLDYESSLATVAAMALPHLGAWCFVDVLEPGGEMRRLVVIHPDPELQVLARRLESGWPPERDDPFGAPLAMRTGRSEVVSAVTDDLLARVSRTEENRQILRKLGIGSLMVVPLIARGEVLGAITYVSPEAGAGYSDADLRLAEDLAARCAITIDNARLYRRALRAQQEAEESSRAKSEFLATMSHEIRTPINAVVGYVDLLETGIAGALSPDQGRYLERIKSATRHLLGLINDVLDLAKADAAQVQIHPEEAVAGPVVDAALDLVRPRVEGRALTLSEACEGDPAVRFVGDVDRVRQIVVNLLVNAIKFTPDGGRIRISCGRAEPPVEARTAERTGPWSFVRVEDTGIGIEAETLARLFEPFVQAETGYSRSREGTGLGLAISRRLARLMDGELTAESRPGEGSTFTLWLPAPAQEEQQAPAGPAGGTPSGGAERVHGVAAIGDRIRADADRIARAYTRRVREHRPVPHIDQLPDATLQDHATSMVADLAQTLVLLEVSTDEVAGLLRDGSAIQRTIADRHGLQRHRIGWTEAALEQEFDILQDELERAVREAAAGEEVAGDDQVLEILRGFLQQSRRGSLRAFRVAGRR